MKRLIPDSQLDLPVHQHGGRRSGAGRPRRSRRVWHRKRPPHKACHPVLITMRTDLFLLREEAVFNELRSCLLDARYRATDPDVDHAMVTHFSIQDNHIHFIVEGETRENVILAAQGIAIRLARAVNRIVGRRGSVWVDRYHSRELTSPRQVRNALVYVLQNRKKHGPLATAIDPYSSAPWFDWCDADEATIDLIHEVAGVWHEQINHFHPPVEPPVTWLLRAGWLRAGGPIGIHSRPRS